MSQSESAGLLPGGKCSGLCLPIVAIACKAPVKTGNVSITTWGPFQNKSHSEPSKRQTVRLYQKHSNSVPNYICVITENPQYHQLLCLYIFTFHLVVVRLPALCTPGGPLTALPPLASTIYRQCTAAVRVGTTDHFTKLINCLGQAGSRDSENSQ